MPDRPPTDADEDSRRLRRSFLIAVCFTAALWAIKLAELALGLDLARYSIYPGNPATLTGILFAPLLHGSLRHLFANTAPMLVLGTALLYGYPKAARVVLPIIYLGSGLAVWLFARPSWHLGASGLAFGLLFFLFTMGVVRWERRAIALALAVFLLYGGMIWGLLPTDPRISFEYHLAGAALGLLLAILLRRLDPPAPEKTYGWEQEGRTTRMTGPSTSGPARRTRLGTGRRRPQSGGPTEARRPMRTLRAVPDAPRAEGHPVGGWVATVSSPPPGARRLAPGSRLLRRGPLRRIDRLSGPRRKGIRVIEEFRGDRVIAHGRPAPVLALVDEGLDAAILVGRPVAVIDLQVEVILHQDGEEQVPRVNPGAPEHPLDAQGCEVRQQVLDERDVMVADRHRLAPRSQTSRHGARIFRYARVTRCLPPTRVARVTPTARPVRLGGLGRRI